MGATTQRAVTNSPNAAMKVVTAYTTSSAAATVISGQVIGNMVLVVITVGP